MHSLRLVGWISCGRSRQEAINVTKHDKKKKEKKTNSQHQKSTIETSYDHHAEESLLVTG
jgi:hypothetical protein